MRRFTTGARKKDLKKLSTTTNLKKILMQKRIFTQEEFDALPENARSGKIVPAFSDLTQIKSFGKSCSVESQIVLDRRSIEGVGAHKRKLTCWNLEGRLFFQAGCFWGTQEALEKAVAAKYPIDNEYTKAINFLVTLIKI